MGWISKRKLESGSGLHSNKGKPVRGPLRLIVEVLDAGSFDLFSPGARVRLECGHVVSSHGTKRARCWKCKREAEESGNE